MAGEWYYKTATNKEHGPFTSAELKRLASQGRINPGTMVRKGVDGMWASASKVKGLVDMEAVRAKDDAQVQVVRTPPALPPSIKSNNEPEVRSRPDPRLQSIRDRMEAGQGVVPTPRGGSLAPLRQIQEPASIIHLICLGAGKGIAFSFVFFFALIVDVGINVMLGTRTVDPRDMLLHNWFPPNERLWGLVLLLGGILGAVIGGTVGNFLAKETGIFPGVVVGYFVGSMIVGAVGQLLRRTRSG